MQAGNNKYNLYIRILFNYLVILCLILGAIDCSLAAGVKVKTNINPVTSQFDKEIDNKQELEGQIEALKEQAEKGIEGEQGIKELEVSRQDITTKTKELDAVNPDDLSAKGLEERAKPENSYYESLIVDYDSLGAKEHKKDMNLISSASGKKISKLLEGLKSINIDCNEVKGNIEQEPEYKLDIVKEEVKNTVYEQVLCEESRSSYDCRDSLIMNCATRGIGYGNWQDREIAIDGYFLFNNFPSWGQCMYSYSVDTWFILQYQGRAYYKTSFGNLTPQQINDQVRGYIANSLGVGINQIYDYISFPLNGVGIGNKVSLGYMNLGRDGRYERRYVWSKYVFKYKYRDAFSVCLKWSQVWSEVCTLK